ncbi:helix-turn-helix domain-containing protein [Kineococcus sp. T13]|uniref:AraC-like ligand-binding domain-containing protein n=1 Tax=Kineococcus vitellinus TaxID=2696565 RepID=UPI0014122C29|nr:helix-turn-helix domain-containing protein [Kineococcus vitellinus]NAZ74254.1 helix-turn-helix domain-containing protein [Kineococcus vitellinus]
MTSTTPYTHPATGAGLQLQGIDAFSEAVSSAFVPLQVSTSAPDRFRAHLRSRGAAGIEVIEIDARRHLVERTPGLVQRGGAPRFKVSVQLEGSCLLVQSDREAVLAAGDVAVYDTSRPYSMAFDDDFRALILMFPHSLIGLPPEQVREVTATRFDGAHGVGAVVAPFLAHMAEQLERVAEPARARLSSHALDLVTTLVCSELDVRSSADARQRALLARIHEHIEARLADPTLSPVSIAAAHHVSTRHLHALFRAEGATVAAWIKQRRLERCRRDLTDPAQVGLPVAAIGARWGFSDPAHFSHAYKGAYGEPPSRARGSAQRG